MAMSLAAKQLMWIKKGTDDLSLHDVDYHLLGDNQGPLELVRNPIIRSKHIDIHYHFVRERRRLQKRN
jgi:hypothetical protein